MAPRRDLTILVACMLPLALAWWLIVPPWEAPDGVWHWHFAAHLADGGTLPVDVFGHELALVPVRVLPP